MANPAYYNVININLALHWGSLLFMSWREFTASTWVSGFLCVFVFTLWQWNPLERCRRALSVAIDRCAQSGPSRIVCLCASGRASRPWKQTIHYRTFKHLRRIDPAVPQTLQLWTEFDECPQRKGSARLCVCKGSMGHWAESVVPGLGRIWLPGKRD